MMIDGIINGFTTNEFIIHLHICDQSIFDLGKIGSCLGFSNTYHVDTLDIFKKSVVEKVKGDIDSLMNQKHLKEEKKKIKY